MLSSAIPLFYVPGAAEGMRVLDAGESHHALHVLRLREGSRISVVDGKGHVMDALLAAPEGSMCRFTVLSQGNLARHGYRLHIAISPMRSTDRLEWFLEKAVEIGIDEITPLGCARTLRKHLNAARLHKVLVSAMKQSLKAHLPVLHPLTPFGEVVSLLKADRKLICRMDAPADPSGVPGMWKATHWLFLVGPEGDFSEDETALAVEHGFIPFSFGPMRLRTETAGIHLCSMANILHTLNHDR